MAPASKHSVSSSPSWWKRICRWLWKIVTILWGVIIAGIAFNTISNIFTTSTTTPLSRLYVINWIVTYHVTLLFVTAGLLALTIVTWVGSRERSTISPLSANQQSRLGILKGLRKAYTDEFDSSLQGVTRIELGLHERFDLTHPTRLVSWQIGKLERALPAGTSIVEAYDQAGHGLLLLGEPGAGKSTLLYDLAQVLLTRAEQDETLPLPVILNLSSWTTQQQALQEWLAEELELRYLIPRALGQHWQQNGQWLPLLDGLDEVAAEKRSACIEVINTYHAQHLLPIVVCSRLEEYLTGPKKVTLQSAVIVQPLEPEHVKMYLKNIGRPLTAMRKVLRTNTILQELLTTPLMLSIVMLAFKDKAIKYLPQVGSPGEQRRYIFASYVQRMLYEQKPVHFSTPQQLQSQLVWLAQQLQQRNQSLFFLEQLQSDWLIANWSQKLYKWLGVYVPGAFVGSLITTIACDLVFSNTALDLFPLVIGALIGGSLATKQTSPAAEQLLQKEYQVLIKLGMFVLIGYGIFEFFNLYYRIDFEGDATRGTFILTAASLSLIMILLWLQPSHKITSFSREPTKNRWFFLAYSFFRNYLVYALLVGIFIGVGVALAQPRATLGLGVVYGLGFGLSGLLTSLLLVNRPATIEPIEILIWSWRSIWCSLLARNHIRNAVIIGLITTFILGLMTAINLSAVHYPSPILGFIGGLSSGVPVGIIYWLLVGFLQGVSHDTFYDHERTSSNQGIRRSLRNGLLLALVGSAISTPVCILGLLLGSAFSNGVYFVLKVTSISDALNGGWQVALTVGVLVGFSQGGLAWWRHWVLRFLLFCTNALPWRIVRMLDEATRHILLRKSGGGYRFIHVLFRDYLASLGSTTSSRSPLNPSP